MNIGKAIKSDFQKFQIITRVVLIHNFKGNNEAQKKTYNNRSTTNQSLDKYERLI